MPKGHPSADTKALRKALSLVKSEQANEIKQLLQIVKETDARSRVMFTKVHNLGILVETAVEVIKKHTLAVLELSKELSELVEAPENLHHAEAVVRDYLRKMHE